MPKLNRVLLIGFLLAFAAGVPVQSERLVLGLIPAENNEEMVRQFEPMRA